MAPALADVDLLDHDLFAKREPWDVFEVLQREAPVYRHPEPEGPGFWCVTRYDDVAAEVSDYVSRGFRTFILDIPRDPAEFDDVREVLDRVVMEAVA